MNKQTNKVAKRGRYVNWVLKAMQAFVRRLNVEEHFRHGGNRSQAREDICCFSWLSIPSPSGFTLVTLNFPVLWVGGLGGADLFPISGTNQHLPSPFTSLQWLMSSEGQSSPGLLLEPWPGEGSACCRCDYRVEVVSSGLQTPCFTLGKRSSLRREPGEKRSRDQR